MSNLRAQRALVNLGRNIKQARLARRLAMLDLAERYKGQGGKEAKAKDLSWREKPVGERISHALVNGITEYIEGDILC